MNSPDEVLTEFAVVAPRGKERRLVVAEMAQTVGAQLVSAESGDKTRDLACASRHQRALEGGVVQTVQNTCGDTDDVFGGGADLAADQVVSDVKADQLACKLVDKLFFTSRLLLSMTIQFGMPLT